MIKSIYGELKLVLKRSFIELKNLGAMTNKNGNKINKKFKTYFTQNKQL